MKTGDLKFYLIAHDSSGHELASREAHPLFPENISLKWTKHEGDEFYLMQNDVEFTFTHQDQAFIASYSLGTEFTLLIRSLIENPEDDEVKLYALVFKQVDGTFDYLEGAGDVFKVTPRVEDSLYDEVLARLDEEVDLFRLENAPEMVKVGVSCRPILQVYVLHTGYVGNWLGSVYWETPVADEDFYFSSGYPVGSDPDLNNVLDHRLYGFRQMGYLSKAIFRFESANGTTPSPDPLGMTDTIIGNGPNQYGTWDLTGTYNMSNGFVLVVSHSSDRLHYEIKKNNTVYWSGYDTPSSTFPFRVTMYAQAGTGASVNLNLYVDAIQVASRLLANAHPVVDSNNQSWGTIPVTNTNPPSGSTYWNKVREDDPFYTGRNHKFYIQYNAPDNSVLISGEKTETPNQFGLYQPDIYYKPQTGYQPFAPSSWGAWSIWHVTRWFDSQIDATGSIMEYKDCYTLWSVLYVLLKHINPNIEIYKDGFSTFFDNNPNHPDAGNPVFPNNVIMQTREINVFLTPSSNILSVTYDQPATRAKITLGKVLGMLKKVYKVYWYLFGSEFRCEHISWFERGGSYINIGNRIAEDLTTLKQPLLNLPWSYSQSERSVDKSKLYSSIYYQWAENTSDPFNGRPMMMVEDYVDSNLKLEESIDGFVSDVDMLMASPDSFSKDTFVLLDADKTENGYELASHDVYVPADQATYTPQNWRLTSLILNMYFRSWSLPCSNITIEGQANTANSIARNLTLKATWPNNQLNHFYSLVIDGPFKNLIRTPFGDGSIQDLSVYLLSRKAEATLRLLLPGQNDRYQPEPEEPEEVTP